MSSVTTSSTECGDCHPSRSRSGDSTRATGCPAAADAAEGEVGDGDGVDVVELAVVDVALGQLGVVERQEADEQRVVGLAQGGDVAQPAERLGDRPTTGAAPAGRPPSCRPPCSGPPVPTSLSGSRRRLRL